MRFPPKTRGFSDRSPWYHDIFSCLGGGAAVCLWETSLTAWTVAMTLEQWFSTGAILGAPQDTGPTLETFSIVTTGEVCYGHLADKGQGPSSTFHGAQDRLPQQRIASPESP